MPDIHLAFEKPHERSGWGVATRQIAKELRSRILVSDLRTDKHCIHGDTVDGKVFHAIKNIHMEPGINVLGDYNAGYCFFELSPTPATLKNAQIYDHIFCGSTYNRMVLADKADAYHTSVLLQGVDMNVFRPPTKGKDKSWQDKFVIFSGGKFEYRKGQDLVLAAFKVLQHKYKDLHLVTAWENPWATPRETMQMSKLIDGEITTGGYWTDIMNAVCAKNRIFLSRVWHYPLVDQRTIYNIIRNSDIGVFPNRCEGGTNLVMMEYMACGKSVIASYNTGHVDVLNERNAMLLKNMTPEKHQLAPQYFCEWDEPDLDELIAKIEWAYENRDALLDYGKMATVSMRNFTWAKTAQHIINVMLDKKVEAPTFLPQRHQFGKMMTRMGLLGEGVEVGVFRGEFSELLREQWNGKRLHLVDRWRHVDGYADIANRSQEEQDKSYAEVKALFASDPGVNVIRMDSVEAAKQFHDGSLDFVYIDADHSYEGCKRDIEAWAPKVRIGGVVSGHDFMDGTTALGVFGVKSAVTEYVAANGYHLMLSSDEINPLRTWYFVKDH